MSFEAHNNTRKGAFLGACRVSVCELYKCMLAEKKTRHAPNFIARAASVKYVLMQ